MDFIGNRSSGATDYGYRGLATAARGYRNNSWSGTLGAVLTPPTSLAAVSPYGGPATNVLLGANYDPLFAVSNVAALTPGVLLLVKLQVPDGGVLSNIWFATGGAATAPTSGQNFVGVYAAPAGGALLGTSADQTAGNFASGGAKVAALTVATAAQPAGTAVYVAFLFNGTTAPTIRGITGSPAAVNILASPARFATAGTGLTSLPSTLPTLIASLIPIWAGVA